MTEKMIRIDIFSPGCVKQGVAVSAGTTIIESIMSAGFTDLPLHKLMTRVDGEKKSFLAQIERDCTILFTTSASWHSFEMHPPKRIVSYYDGRHGVRQRRKEIDHFITAVNGERSEIIRLEENDPRGREMFIEHAALLQDKDTILLTYDMTDLNNDIVRPVALEAKSFVVSIFEGSPLGSGSEDAHNHVRMVLRHLLEKHIATKQQRSLTSQNLDDQSAAYEQDMELLDNIKSILSKPSTYNDQWAISNNDLVDELRKQYRIKISISMLDKRIGRLDKKETGTRAMINAMKNNNKKRNKQLLNSAHQNS